MDSMNGVTVTERKRKIGKSALIFMCIMLLLTFFSSTINNYSLPRVKYEFPSRGSIVKEIFMDGNINAEEVFGYYAGSAMKVLDVKVKAWEKVKKGQQLVLLDTESIKRQLADETDRYEQKKIALERLRDTVYEDNTADCDRLVEAAANKLERVRKEYEHIKLLYESDCETQEELESAAKDVENAQWEYNKALSDRESAERNYRESLANNERDIKSLLYDLDIQERVIEDLREQLQAGSVIAPFDGAVIELNVGKGTVTDGSRPLYRMVDTSKGYRFTGSVASKSASYISIGDTASVSIDALGGKSFDGTVVEIRDSQEEKGLLKVVVIEVKGEGLEYGQQGSAVIRKSTKAYNALVSNNALGKDINGYFVYILKQRKGLLGTELYVQAVHVTVDESDDKKTAVINGLDHNDMVVADTDKPLSDGMRVISGS